MNHSSSAINETSGFTTMIQHQGSSLEYLRTIARIAAAAVFCVVLSVPLGARAQSEQPSQPSEQPPAQQAGQPGKSGGAGKTAAKHTTINFEDQLVEGQTQKPELFYLLQQRNNNFKRLIRPRENFLPEMRKTSETVGRPGSGKGSDN
jgi:hypothetical protein